MRGVRHDGVAFVVLVLVSSAHGSAAVIEDPEGDVSFGGVADPSGAFGGVDISSLEIVENLILDSIDFRVSTYDVPNTDSPQGKLPEYHVSFMFYGTPLEVNMVVMSEGAQLGGTWRLYEKDNLDTLFIAETLGGGFLDFENGGRTTIAHVPRLQLQEVGPVRPGMALQGTALLSRKSIVEVCCGPEGEPIGPEFTDRAPDTGRVDLSLDYGVDFSESLLLWSPSMIRGSNGGTMTIVFPLQLTSKFDSVDIEVLDAPEAWNVAIPVDHLDRPVEDLVIPIIITAEFVHQHGKLEFMTVLATTGEARATAPVGIQYLAIPQPTGHHPRLWMHALPSETTSVFEPAFGAFHHLVMNALQDDERAEPGLGVAGSRSNATAPGPTSPTATYGRDWTWRIPLNPEMRLGIDPIPNGTGTIQFEAEFPAPATIDWRVEVDWITDTRETFFEGELLAQKFAEGSNRVAMELRQTEMAGYRVGGDNVQLELGITAHGAFEDHLATEAEMVIFDGGEMQLPLGEFSDSIVSVLPPSDIKFLGDAWTATLPPGSTFKQSMTLMNTGNRSHHVEVRGQGLAPITVEVKPKGMTLEPGERADVDVTLTVPNDARAQSSNAVVAITDTGDIAIKQWFVTLDGEAPLPSGAALQGDANKDSPIPVGSVIGALLVGVALLRRRQE